MGERTEEDESVKVNIIDQWRYQESRVHINYSVNTSSIDYGSRVLDDLRKLYGYQEVKPKPVLRLVWSADENQQEK